MPTSATFDARLTYDDLVRMPEDGMRHELIDGAHFVTPSPSVRHQDLVGRLHLAIGSFLEKHPEHGRVFVAPLDTVMSRWDVVVPDLVFIAAAQLDILTAPNVQGAPALVIEVLSPGTKKRDIGVKLRLYDRAGVVEYWLVDPIKNVVTVHHRTGESAFTIREVLDDLEMSLTTPLLRDFRLSLKKLFRE